MIFLSFLHGGTGKYWELKRDENARERKTNILKPERGNEEQKVTLCIGTDIFGDYAKKKRRSAHNAMSLR